MLDNTTAQAGNVTSAENAGPDPEYDATLAARRQSYGPNAALSYEQPLMIVRGQGTYLYDEQGQSYLDCVNNVSHVGHGNAEVASAISSQLHTLNTNSRYLHPMLPVYTRMILDTLNYNSNGDCNSGCNSGGGGNEGCGSGGCSVSSGGCSVSSGGCSGPSEVCRAGSMAGGHGCGGSGNGGSDSGAGVVSSGHPGGSSYGSRTDNAGTPPGAGPSLDVLYLVCSGSEANDLALRIIAAARPGATHVAVMGGAYHGHLTSLIPLSPYKFWGAGGGGRPPYVHVVPCPDPYRGENLDGRAAAVAVLEAARKAGGRLGGFLCESILSCGGQVVLPPGYLQSMYDVLRAAGVVVVADEVQCGFGRCGTAFWGFQTQGVRPDIVTMGKPIGNGYPMAALATSRELATAFAAPGMEYFNTYGGSTAAVAAGVAVLRVLQRDRLQEHAQAVGTYLLAGLRRLSEQHQVLGDVRGQGLFLGIEVVRDKASKRHAPVIARWIKERMKARRVLLSTDGPYDNVIKIKPPMVFGFSEADKLMQQLSEVLTEELTPSVRQDLTAREEKHWAAVVAPRQAKYRENERLLGLAVARPQARL